MIGMAWRNLWRQGRRSLIAIFAVAVVVFMAIFMYGLGGAGTNSLYQDLTGEIGHMQIHVDGWRDARDFDDGLLRNAATVRTAVEAVAPELDLVAVLQVPALVAGEDRSRGIPVTGQRWSDRMRDAFRAQHLAEGSFLEPGEIDGILLGRALADALEVELGDDVYVYAPGTDGYGAAAYTLRGLLDFDDPTREIASAYLSLEAAQELAAPNALTRIELHDPEARTLAADEEALAVVGELRARLGDGVVVDTWGEVEPGLATVMNLLIPVVAIESIIFFLLAGLLVLNTVYLSTLERIREFGVMLSLGAKGRQVMALVTTESVLMCLTGAALGLAGGLGLIAALSDGFTFPGMADSFAQLGISPILYPYLEPWQVLLAVGFAVATAIGAALWPARIAASIEPAEAMRYTA